MHLSLPSRSRTLVLPCWPHESDLLQTSCPRVKVWKQNKPTPGPTEAEHEQQHVLTPASGHYHICHIPVERWARRQKPCQNLQRNASCRHAGMAGLRLQMLGVLTVAIRTWMCTIETPIVSMPARCAMYTNISSTVKGVDGMAFRPSSPRTACGTLSAGSRCPMVSTARGFRRAYDQIALAAIVATGAASKKLGTCERLGEIDQVVTFLRRTSGPTCQSDSDARNSITLAVMASEAHASWHTHHMTRDMRHVVKHTCFIR